MISKPSLLKIEVQKTVTYLFTCLKMDDTIAMFYATGMIQLRREIW